MRTDLSSYNNDWFKTGGGVIKRALWYFVNILFFMNPLNPLSSLKVRILRLFGAKIGKGVVIKPSVNIKYPWNLSIGDNSWIGEKVWIDNLVHVSIGKNVCLSQGAMLLCGNHNFKLSSFDLMVGKIILEDGVWIGAQTTVCPGVIAQTHSVLCVGSIASKIMEPFTIYRGNPAIAVAKRVISK